VLPAREPQRDVGIEVQLDGQEHTSAHSTLNLAGNEALIIQVLGPQCQHAAGFLQAVGEHLSPSITGPKIGVPEHIEAWSQLRHELRDTFSIRVRVAHKYDAFRTLTGHHPCP
jgi:hypothetical protein